MKKREVASFVIFSGAVATLAYAVAGSEKRDAPSDGACDNRIFYPLVPGRALEFILAPDARQLMLASLAVHPESLLERHPVTYGFDVEWVDPDGASVEQRTYSERSWFAPEQDSPPALSPASPHLPDDTAQLADERFTFFPARLPAGGTLRLIARPGDGLLLVRLYYAAEAADAVERQAPPDHRGQRAHPEKRGPVAWGGHEEAEIARRMRNRWTSATIRGNRGDDFDTRLVQLCDSFAPFHDRPALTLTLAPGRATAVNFNEATQVRLSGDDGLLDLSAHLVADRPPSVAVDQPLDLTPAEPLAGLGFAAGALIDVRATDSASLVLRNASTRPVSFVASVDAPSTTGFFGAPALVGLRDLGARFAASETVLVGPELRYLEMHRIGPDDPEPLRYAVADFGQGDPIRLRVRALTGQPSGDVERQISVTLLDAAGERLHSSTRLVSFPVSPFERALAMPRPPIEPRRPAERVTDDALLYVTSHPRGHRLEVRADRTVLVSASAEGLPRGDARLYRLRHGSARVRFGDGLETTWHRIQPANAEDLRGRQTMRLEAVVRLEDNRPDRGARGGPAYALLVPASRARRKAARLYLVRESRVRQRPVGYYCSFVAGAEQAYRLGTTAWDHNAGLLRTVLWAPAAALGSSFRVHLDDRLWLAGVVRARVTRNRRAAPDTAKRLTLEGEPGVRLWLQAFGRQWPCRAPHRVVNAFPLPAGASASFAWRKNGHAQGILLTGFSSGTATLDARIDGGRLRSRIGLHEYATPSSWTSTLPVTSETAQQLLAPDASFRRLSVDVRRVGNNIRAGKHRLTIRNLSPQSVDLRVLLQTDAPPQRRLDRAQWVRRDAFDEVW